MDRWWCKAEDLFDHLACSIARRLTGALQREFQEGECGEDKQRRQRHHHRRRLRRLGESPALPCARARADVPCLCSSIRMAPRRRRSRQGDPEWHRDEQDPDKEILKIVKEKNNYFRRGMITDNLDLSQTWMYVRHRQLLDGN